MFFVLTKHCFACCTSNLGYELTQMFGNGVSQGEKFQHRSGRHEGVRQDGDSAWERSQNVRRQEEAEILARLTANKKTVMSRPYVLQERKVHNNCGLLFVLVEHDMLISCKVLIKIIAIEEI